MAKKKFDFKKIAMKVAGAAGGGVIATVANKPLANFDPKLRGAAKVLVGAVLPEFAPKSLFLDDMGAGMIGVGAAELVGELVPGLVSGIGSTGIGYDEQGFIEDEAYDLSGINDDPDEVISGEADEVVGTIGDDDDDDDQSGDWD